MHRADMATKAPYGQVEYADPGYQKDRKKRYPLDTKDHATAAWSYINQADNAAQYSADDLAQIKAKIKAALKTFGVQVSEDQGATRATPSRFTRWYALEDIRILRSGEGGDGRTVEAYAAVFDSPAAIRDHEGEYLEEIDRTAFNRAIDHARRGRDGWNVRVLYNHGYTVQGTPSERFSVPIGVPVDIRPESRGLLTVTRYNDTPLGEEILEAVRSGSVAAQSFSGKIVRSTPPLRPGEKYRAQRGSLPHVRRMELGLREYGPTPFPAYADAEILGVRMSTPRWDSDASASTHTGDPDADGTSTSVEPAADDPPSATDTHSPRHHQHALYALRSRELREEKGITLI
ncbi:DUF6582 domain-containing protein [Frankia sp. Cj3]|uniref:DUF6582 domain-containing protein n=1 Tax=Frankia sp. Cj3 TaxID=2880976 RepID=UPI001EF52666|nr:DUF6582 domain-containing protein [Frankia sp. Cj3]